VSQRQQVTPSLNPVSWECNNYLSIVNATSFDNLTYYIPSHSPTIPSHSLLRSPARPLNSPEIAHFIEEPFDRKTQIIPLNQIAMVVRADVSELLDNILDGEKDLVQFNKVSMLMHQEYKQNSRSQQEGKDYKCDVDAYYYSSAAC